MSWGLWLASVGAVGVVIAYTRGDGDTTAAVMDRKTEISPKGWRMERRGEDDRRLCVESGLKCMYVKCTVCEVDCSHYSLR